MKIKCIDGKRHFWKSGWACEKCGIRRYDYEISNVPEIREPSCGDIDRLIAKMPSMDKILLRYCLNTGKELRDGAKTRTEQDRATKLMMEASYYLNERETK